MRQETTSPIRLLTLALLMCVSASALAQAPKPATPPAPVPAPARTPAPAPGTGSAVAPTPGVVVTVNGSAITEKEVESLLAKSQSPGKTPTPQMREQAITELAVQRVLLEEAKRMKLDAAPAFIEKLENIRQLALIEALVDDFLIKYPITETDERVEYDRQKKILGNGTTTQQYQLRQVIVRTEQEGRDLIARAQKGEPFEKLVDVSIDQNTRTNGGLVGWVFPTDLLPILGAVVVNLQKGAVAATPVQTPIGWHVLKLDDTRTYKIPTFEEARAQMRQGVLTQRRQALIDDLMRKAVVKRP